MNKSLIQDLAFSFVLRATNDGLRIGTTKLVKLLYLSDCEYFKWNRQTLTGAEWIFYHFGPYSDTLIESINESPSLSHDHEEELEDGRSFRAYQVRVSQPDPILAKPFQVRGVVEKVYKKWAHLPLALLLNHVYFETAPMIAAQRYAPLDFSLIADPGTPNDQSHPRDLTGLIPEDKRNTLVKSLRDRLSRTPRLKEPSRLQIDENDAIALESLGERD